MCLIVANAVLHTAEEDIIVFKSGERVLNTFVTSMHSFLRPFVYKKNVLNETSIRESNEFNVFDSVVSEYMNTTCPGWRYKPFEFYNIKSFGQGFHFSFKKDRLTEGDFCLRDRKIGVFKVPKGAQYYMDETGLGISNQIIYIGNE